jgi:UPF0148 protein
MDKNNIEKMAELLRSGNTMLNKSCPECNSPIFKNKKGELFCPSCNRRVIIKDKISEKDLRNAQKEQTLEKKERNNTEKDLDLKKHSFQVLKDKIIWLLEKLETETQIEIMLKYLSLLKKLYDLLYFLAEKKI